MVDMASDDIICVTTSLHYRLVLCIPIGAATAQSDIILSETCRLALLIYLKPVLCCRMPYNDLLGKLKTCHDSIKASVDTNRREIAELLLWLMFLGGITALNDPNKSWFVAHLREAATELGIYSWDGAKLVLVKFLWVQHIHEGHSWIYGTKLWKGQGGSFLAWPENHIVDGISRRLLTSFQMCWLMTDWKVLVLFFPQITCVVRHMPRPPITSVPRIYWRHQQIPLQTGTGNRVQSRGRALALR